MFFQQLLSVICLLVTTVLVLGDDSQWSTIDTNRDHVPYLETSFPGECPTGSTCRMMHLTFVVPKMSRIGNKEYNFDYGILHCSAVFSDRSNQFILDGNQARLVIFVFVISESGLGFIWHRKPEIVSKCL